MNDKDMKSPDFISLDEAAEMESGTRVTFIPGMQHYTLRRKNIVTLKKFHSLEHFIP